MGDWFIFAFAIVNIIYNLLNSDERPISTTIFGALWGVLAAMAFFHVGPGISF